MRVRNGWLTGLACAVVFAPAPPASAGRQTQDDNTGQMVRGLRFNTEASKVFTALAHIAHADIVVPEDLKATVSIYLNNISVERAFRLVAAQSGYAYRKIGNAYIVDKLDRIAQSLAQYGVEERVPLQNIATASAVSQIKEAVPFLTARAAGRSILLIGAPEDIAKARTIVQELDSPLAEPLTSVSVPLLYAPAADIQTVLTAQFPLLKAQKIGDTTIAFTGPRGEVQRAQDFIRTLDKGKDANARYVVYQVKYSSARGLVNTLREAVQNLTVVAGPEPYHIPNTRINLSTANSLGGSGSSSGGSSSGSSGGSSSGGSGGGSGGGSDSSSSSDTGTSGGGAGSGGGSQNSTVGYDARSLILGGTEDTVQAALKLLGSLDVPTPQVSLDVKVVSTNPEVTQNLGIEWSGSITSTVFERNSTTALDIPGSPQVRDKFSIGNFGRLPINFAATLNAFFQRSDVRILAKPTITALDNQSGIVFVGETRRVSVASVPTGLGTSNIVLNSVVEIPVGIILQMRPRVNSDGQITLRVHPIYSSGGATDPRTGLFSTFQREADTTVRVRSGETIVIGGLLQDEDTKTFTKVPILGDLPLIGQFFRNHGRDHLRREVLVFVTPHLLKD